MVTVTAVLASDVRKKAVLTVDPNDPLNRILVKAVEGLGLPSPDGFHLRYQRKILTDLSLPIRFAGFPPQAAQVDLVHANDLSIPELKQLASSSKSVLHASLSAESSVTLALQSPSLSNRLHSAVKVQATLWQVLLAFESASEGAFQAIKVGADTSIHAPEVIINNHKISDFAQITQCRLVDLGLTSGSFLMRVTHQKSQMSMEELSKLIPADQSDLMTVEAPKPKAPSAESATSVNHAKNSHSDVSHNLADQTQADDYDMDLLIYDAKRLEIAGTPSVDLPDSFYTLTSDELKVFYASTQKATRSIVEGRPLVTKATQENLKIRSILASHPLTRIRFRFPDKMCLERNFRTTDSIETLIAFLGNTVKGAPRFSLAVGPPLKILKEMDTLLSLNLYPAAVINVIWQIPNGTAQTSIRTDALLPSNVRSEPGCESQAKRPNSPVPIPATADPTTASVPKEKSSKIPKWFKAFKK